jgi:hypothetical protein
MPHPQLSVLGDRTRRDAVDPAAAPAFVAGKTSLVQALRIGPDLLEDFRRQAQSLYGMERWDDCARMIDALIVLDEAHPHDVALLAACRERAGDALGAHEAYVLADRMMAILEIEEAAR